MKILYHHRTQAKGAEGVHIREVVKALRETGDEVFIVSPPGIDVFEEDVSVSRQGTILSRLWKYISRYFPQIGFEILELCYNLTAHKNIKAVLEKEKIDFIYERCAFFLWAGAYLAKKYGIPIILEVNEVSGIKRNRPQILKGLIKKIEKQVFTKADAVIAVSSFLKKRIESMGIVSDKIYLIPNAVNIKQFNSDIQGKQVRSEFGLDGKIVLGFVGCFSWWDNLIFLGQAFSDLLKRQPNLHLLLIGDGDAGSELAGFVKQEKLEESITLNDRVPRSRIPEFIAAMDICLIPHSNPFGSPIVLFEYMAMAKPVVAPDLGPIEDVISHNSNGLLFKLNDAETFKQAILELAEDRERRISIGSQAREVVLKRHLWRHNAKRIIEIYKGLR
ncbi:MAG: glycosyltransferase family 4 protein [Candidatus Omnitrophota bacterium]